MGKGQAKHPKVKRIDLRAPAVKEFLQRVHSHALLDEDYEIIQGMAETIQCLSQALEDNTVSLKRLLRYLLGAPTETAKNLLAQDASKETGEPQGEKPTGEQKPPPKGHGRNGAASYTGGRQVKVPHPSLQPRDRCPACLKGKLYELALPSVMVRIVGNAPLESTVFELTRLRCNLCGELFTAPAPEEATQGKYDESVASTQWEIIEAAAAMLEPVHGALLSAAAQGEVVHNDDTTARILDFLKEQDRESTRKGVFTTGLVSVNDDRRIGIFMTGRNHAGENLEELLKARASGLSPPIQMCDALSRNVPKEFETILANCLAHARRQFADLVEVFPEACRHVIELLAKVYHHDALARERGLDPLERLAFHQKESAPIMDELKTWCAEQISQKLVEPNSGLGKAIQYLLKRWDKFTRFLDVPKVPLDNNICERALKLAVRHRRNALFFKTQNGAHVGDVFMSLIHTCQLAGENPFHYLTALLRHPEMLAQAPEPWFPWSYRETLKSG